MCVFCVTAVKFSVNIPDYAELARENLARLRRARSEVRSVRPEAVGDEQCRKFLIGC